jgi:hypothetical protein
MIELIKTVFSLFLDKQIRVAAITTIILCTAFSWLDKKFEHIGSMIEKVNDRLVVYAPKDTVTELGARIERVDKRLIVTNEGLVATNDKVTSIEKTIFHIIDEYYLNRQKDTKREN